MTDNFQGDAQRKFVLMEQVDEALHLPFQVDFLTFPPSGRLVAAATDERPVQIWDRTTRQITSASSLEEREVLHSVVFTSSGVLVTAAFRELRGRRYDGDRLVPHGVDGIVRVRRSDRSDVVSLPDHDPAPTGVACSPNGELIATIDPRWRVRLWHVSIGAIVATREWQGGQQESLILSRYDLVTFSPDGRYLALCCDDRRQQAQLWRVDESAPALAWIGTISHLPWLAKCSFSPDGRHLFLLLGSEKRRYPAREVVIYEVPSLDKVERIRLPTMDEGDDVIMDAALSPDGTYLAVATVSARVLLWDRTQRRFILSFQAHLDFSAGGTPYARYAQFFSLNQVAWTPDGSCLATGGYCPDPNDLRFSVRLWRMVSVEDVP